METFGVNQPRFYRFWTKENDLYTFDVRVKETDLHIRASEDLKKEALASIKKHRKPIEDFIIPPVLKPSPTWLVFNEFIERKEKRGER